MIDALSGQDVPIVKAGGITRQMPLPDHASMITGRLQYFGDRGLAAIKAIEHGDAVDVTVFSGENRRPARRANGIDDETILESHPLPGNAVQVRRFIDLAA